MIDYPFPDEFSTPKEKESREYGLKYARAAYYSTNRFGMRLYDDQQFNALIELAQGRQSVDNLRKTFGYFSQTQNMGTGDENSSLAYMDVQVLNLLPKYINRAVAKMMRFKYDIDLAVVDPISVDDSKRYQTTVKAFYALKDWMDTMKLDIQQFFPDIDVAILPQYSDELMLNINANPKIKKAIDGTKTLQLLHEINKVWQTMREWAWDCVVIGRGHIETYLDANKVPRAQRVNPKYWGGSYCNNEDFSKQEYSFYIDFITINQFRKEAEGQLTDEEIQKVLRSFAYPAAEMSYSTVLRDYSSYDGLQYIPVCRFYFLSNDNRAYQTWTSEMGAPMIEETKYTYNQKPRDIAKGKKVIKNTYTSVYGGAWCLNSDIVWNYGNKDYPRTNLVNQTNPIVTFAPNMKEGRVVSLAAQTTEIIFMINVAWNRIKDILASGFMGIQELNFTAMENVALGKGGKVWTARQVYEHMLQTRRLVSRQVTSPYGQAMGPAVMETKAGLQMVDYMNTIQLCIKFLDDLTGSSVVESPSIPDRLSVGVMNQNIAAANESLEYLINGFEQTYKNVSHHLLLLAQVAKRDKVRITGMIPALGKSTTEFFEVPDEIAYCEYGLYMTRQPTQEEWMEFYGEVREAMANKMINASDSAFIRDLRNLKEARLVLAQREKENERKAMQFQDQERKFQMDIAGQQIQMKEGAEERARQADKAITQENMMLEARIQDALLIKKAMLDGELQGVSNMVEQQIKKQQGIDTIIKEAMRSKADNFKTEKQHESKVLAAAQQHETAISTAIIAAQAKIQQAKVKPKPKAS